MEILRALCVLIGSVVLGALAAATVLSVLSFIAGLFGAKDDDR